MLILINLNSVDSNHRLTHTNRLHQNQRELSTFLSLCVYLAREDRNIPGIWWKGWRRQSIRLPFTLGQPGLVGCTNDLQCLSGSLQTCCAKHPGHTEHSSGCEKLSINLAHFDKQRISKLSCSDTLPCVKKEMYLNLWPHPTTSNCDVCCDQRFNRLKPQEVSETMLFRLVL